MQGLYPFLSAKQDKAAVDAVLASDKPIDQGLFKAYADNFRKAIDAVPLSDLDLRTQWNANVSRFAAFKAYAATSRIRKVNDEYGREYADRMFRSFNRYQAAEYNTAVARARTGKQWTDFSQTENARLFPSVRWLPSRSATPREEHIQFYYRVWTKDDPFWATNQPGNLWNCKCDWEQTSDGPTSDNPSGTIARPGLDRNPATSGQIFTDSAPYISKAPQSVQDYAINVTRKDSFDWAKKNIKDKTLKNAALAKDIHISGKGLRDFFNQPIDDPFIRNEIARNIEEIFKNAKYKGYSDYKSDNFLLCSHIFEASLGNKNYWLIVHEYANGDVNLYSISRSEGVLKGIKKEST